MCCDVLWCDGERLAVEVDGGAERRSEQSRVVFVRDDVGIGAVEREPVSYYLSCLCFVISRRNKVTQLFFGGNGMKKWSRDVKKKQRQRQRQSQ